MAYAVAISVADEVEVGVNDAEAAAQNRRAMGRFTQGIGVVGSVDLRAISRPKKCLFGPGLDLMPWLCEMTEVAKISAERALERTLRFFSAGSSHLWFFTRRPFLG